MFVLILCQTWKNTICYTTKICAKINFAKLPYTWHFIFFINKVAQLIVNVAKNLHNCPPKKAKFCQSSFKKNSIKFCKCFTQTTKTVHIHWLHIHTLFHLCVWPKVTAKMLIWLDSQSQSFCTPTKLSWKHLDRYCSFLPHFAVLSSVLY